MLSDRGERLYVQTKSERFGELVMVTPSGRWYWDRILLLITFQPFDGKQITEIGIHRDRFNTKDHVIKTICRRVLDGYPY